jgi:hypothetical protein
LLDEIERLRTALERYGRHEHPNCYDLTLKEDGSFGPRNGCLCGFDAAKGDSSAHETDGRAQEAFRIINAATYYVPLDRQLHKDMVAWLKGATTAGASPEEPTVTPEFAAGFERGIVKKVIEEVAALAGDRTGTYWAAHAQACEEIQHRLDEAWKALPVRPVETSETYHGIGCATRRGEQCNCAAADKPEKILVTRPLPDHLKAPVKAGDPCPAIDDAHTEHEGKCVYCGAPMAQVKATECFDPECAAKGFPHEHK